MSVQPLPAQALLAASAQTFLAFLAFPALLASQALAPLPPPVVAVAVARPAVPMFAAPRYRPWRLLPAPARHSWHGG
jgi:hypothetical protein